jgi:hypothetical protein
LAVQGQLERSLSQPPTLSLQLSTEQATPSSQDLTAPPHLPPVQVSVGVQTELSLQAEPSGLGGFVQLPVAESHVPARWQPSSAAQLVWVLGVQLPD